MVSNRRLDSNAYSRQIVEIARFELAKIKGVRLNYRISFPASAPLHMGKTRASLLAQHTQKIPLSPCVMGNSGQS